MHGFLVYAGFHNKLGLPIIVSGLYPGKPAHKINLAQCRPVELLHWQKL